MYPFTWVNQWLLVDLHPEHGWALSKTSDLVVQQYDDTAGGLKSIHLTRK